MAAATPIHLRWTPIDPASIRVPPEPADPLPPPGPRTPRLIALDIRDTLRYPECLPGFSRTLAPLLVLLDWDSTLGGVTAREWARRLLFILRDNYQQAGFRRLLAELREATTPEGRHHG